MANQEDDSSSASSQSIIPKVTTPGDVGASTLGMALGYFGDVWLSAHFPHLGIPPGAASMYLGAAFLGVKNTVQAVLGQRKTSATAKHATPLAKADQLLLLMEQEIKTLISGEQDSAGLKYRLALTQLRTSLLSAARPYEGFVNNDESIEAAIKMTLTGLSKAREDLVGEEQSRPKLSDGIH